jgi:copper chaperone CopZ
MERARGRAYGEVSPGTAGPGADREKQMTTETSLTRTVLRSDELNCPTCVGKIEKRLGALPGVARVKVSFATGRIEVEHDPAATSVDELVAGIRSAGYRAVPGRL